MTTADLDFVKTNIASHYVADGQNKLLSHLISSEMDRVIEGHVIINMFFALISFRCTYATLRCACHCPFRDFNGNMLRIQL